MTNLNEARLVNQRSGYVNKAFEQEVNGLSDEHGDAKLTNNVTTISR